MCRLGFGGERTDPAKTVLRWTADCPTHRGLQRERNGDLAWPPVSLAVDRARDVSGCDTVPAGIGLRAQGKVIGGDSPCKYRHAGMQQVDISHVPCTKNSRGRTGMYDGSSDKLNADQASRLDSEPWLMI